MFYFVDFSSGEEVGAGVVSFYNFEEFFDFECEFVEMFEDFFDIVVDCELADCFIVLLSLELVGELGGSGQ